MGKVKSRESQDELQVDSNLTIHHREWTIQRISWIVLFALLGAGGIGLFGDGPLSHATAHSNALTVKYERYARHSARTLIQVMWQQKPASGAVARISLDRVFLESLELQYVLPQANHVSTASGRTVFEFIVDSTATNHQVTFAVQPDDFGRHETWIRLGSTDSVRISQFAYP